MILIIGGASQEKLQFALRYTGCSLDDVGGDGIVADKLHLLIRETLEQDGDIGALLIRMLAKRSVICDEIGCGVVPVDAFERRWRDEVGLSFQFLAG